MFPTLSPWARNLRSFGAPIFGKPPLRRHRSWIDGTKSDQDVYLKMTDRVCLIGAGSSGVVAAKVLLERGIPFDCFELGSGIGGLWRYNMTTECRRPIDRCTSIRLGMKWPFRISRCPRITRISHTIARFSATSKTTSITSTVSLCGRAKRPSRRRG